MQVRSMKFQICLFYMLFTCASVFAQQGNQQEDPFHDKDGNTWHQLFLDFKAEEILELNYLNSTQPVEGELAPDGLSILIKNYPGDQAVKAVLKLPDGESKEVSKGKCFIDPVLFYL
jgi:hypothetical protein